MTSAILVGGRFSAFHSWGDDGFAGSSPTTSVLDPFGNVLGVTYNPHYLDVLAQVRA
nr:hypothetical protein [Amycolatopsis magusensis]